MPSNTVGEHGWLKIVNGCVAGFYTNDEVIGDLMDRTAEELGPSGATDH